MKRKSICIISLFSLTVLFSCQDDISSSSSLSSSSSSLSTTSEEKTYNIEFEPDDKIIISTSQTAKAGEEITVSLVYTSNVMVDKFYANDVELQIHQGNEYKFIMPESDVELTYTTKTLELQARFINYDGTILDEKVVHYGDTLVYEGIEPTRPSTDKANYTFIGWDKSLENIQEDTDFYALYQAETTEDFIFELDEETNTYVLAMYTGDGGDVIIPSTYLNVPVTTISSNAFSLVDTVTSVYVPSSVTTLDNYAFASCSASEILGMQGVLTIGTYAFDSTTNLSTIELGESVETIGNYAFRLSGIREITLPDSITSLGTYLFRECENLQACKLPSNLTAIPNALFYECHNLVDVTIPETVTSIGNNAFQNCRSIVELEVPSSVETVGYYAFSGLESLSSIDLSNTQITTLKQWLFRNCYSLVDVKLPANLTSPSYSIFENCTSLKTVSLPDNITSIRGYFKGCTSLEEITLPSSLTAIEASTFENCSSLVDITLPESITEIGNKAFLNCTSLESINIPNSVTELGDYAFANDTKLTLNISANVTDIGVLALDNTDFTISSESDYKVSGDELTLDSTLLRKLEDRAEMTFSDITEISTMALADREFASITFPSTLTSIQDQAFLGVQGISEITIPDTVTDLGEVFAASDPRSNDDEVLSTSLRKVIVDANVSSISNLFNANSSIEEIRLTNENLEEIGSYTFADCTNLKDIYLPKSIKEVGFSAFANVSKDATIHFEGSRQEWALIHFNNSEVEGINVRFDEVIR